LPPLRDRKTDIPHLVSYYINYFNTVHGIELKGIKPDAVEALQNFSWPGNIRELRNTIEHCFIMESTDWITLESIPAQIKDGTASAEILETVEDAVIDFKSIQNSVLDKDPSEIDDSQYQFVFATKEGDQIKMDFQAAKDKFENEFIIQALKLNKGKINQTALNANIPKKTLLRKIEKYEINPKAYY
jgi:DNA-binding NtrC family response regulator